MTQPYYRFITYRTYSDEDVKAFREDQWTTGDMALPEDYSDFIWQFARDHREAVENHDNKLDVRYAIINGGCGEQETY